jgi:hypothetical protein
MPGTQGRVCAVQEEEDMRKEAKVVRFVHPDWGYKVDQRIAAEHLRVGDYYQVDQVEILAWNTNVFLKDFPGIPFNSVLFEEVSA